MKLSSVITIRKEMVKVVESLVWNQEFERNNHMEIEQKFIPVFPEKLAKFRETARPIEQFYWSNVRDRYEYAA